MSLQVADIQAGKYYRAKKPRRCMDGGYDDRRVLHVDREGQNVQYDSYTVADGRHYPTVPMERFLKWAGKEITKQEYMNTGEVVGVE